MKRLGGALKKRLNWLKTAILLALLILSISDCAHLTGNRTVCIIQKDYVSAECKTGDHEKVTNPISLINGFYCTPPDEAKEYIIKTEQCKSDLISCQKQ